MANNCSIVLKKDKLPVLLNKLEFFMFRAMERRGIDFIQAARQGNAAMLADLLSVVKTDVIPTYINEYTDQAKLNREAGDETSAKDYETAVVNLQNMLLMWKQLSAEFTKAGNMFSVRTKFTLDEDGLIDLSTVADDEDKMMKAMVFDKPSNETDPIEEVNKAVELFIRSIPNEEKFDDYGFTSGVDYSFFVRNLFADLQNVTNIDEMIQRLEQNKSKIPEYQYIIDKLTYTPGLSKSELQFRINFSTSFAKAFIPIYTMSLEDKKVIKVFEAAAGKKNLFEKIIASNFALRGMEVEPGGLNLAHNDDGVWKLDKTDIQKIKDYIENAPEVEFKQRQVNFLKALGFEFSPKTEAFLLSSSFLISSKSDIGKSKTGFKYLYNHLLSILNNLDGNRFVINPISELKKDIKTYDPSTKKYILISGGQNNIINSLIDAELKRNPGYNIERSVINQDGNRVHAIQLHNNFTVLNKYLSDPIAYPTLDSIIQKEPSMFWLDPKKNPSIRSSVFLNSIFYFDPKSENFGQRRRVKADGTFSTTEGEFVTMEIVNTGGVQLKLESLFKKEGSSSTDLNELDKLLQDINLFKSKNFASILRLGDKSTDLAVRLNYYIDPATIGSGKEKASKKPLGSEKPSKKVFSTEEFLGSVKRAIKDVFEVKYLRKQGFLADLNRSSKNSLETWGYFDGILSNKTKALLNSLIDEIPNIEDTDVYLDSFSKEIEEDIVGYFNKYAKAFLSKFDVLRDKMGIDSFGLVNAGNFDDIVYDYLANNFIMDLEQMKTLFGDAFFFKDFHKRASKDSATGIFTFIDENIIKELNDESNSQGYGVNTNLSAKRLIERLYEQKQITKEQRDQALAKQKVTKSFKSGVIKDVNFNSLHKEKILNNIQTLKKAGFISEEMSKLFDDSLSKVISDKYNGTEADGQGKCTFDFYRIMSILTGKWDDAQEKVYKKIVEYSHYDELADGETDVTKKAEYIKKRDAVGYDPTEAVYFPPKKFQYSGPQNYNKLIGTEEYNMYVPVMDKFSLQPLIPTVTKGTADHQLLRKMEFNGVGYVKFESGSKVETPKSMDEMYVDFNPDTPDVRNVQMFSPETKFKSEQELFFNHLKEQVSIDADIHEDATFGSQIRKLIMMNLNRPEFREMYRSYIKNLSALAELEKTKLYDRMGVTTVDGKLKTTNIKKLVEYFFTEISKKNQDSNVRKALKYDEATGKFEIPLDASVQAQIIEGIVISSINNNIVRYKTNGSMLVQMAITGSDKVKFNKQASKNALETYGNSELKYYDIIKRADGVTVGKMDVKIALTGQWLKLLNLTHPDGAKIGSIERLNDALKNEEWVAKNEKSITLVSYRIPTQGRNFLDVMKVKEFLPASVGDAIVMPSEVVIKSGSDFDIDKMFTFYPNLNSDGSYMSSEYTDADLANPEKYNLLKGAIQNKVYETMADVILHPSNYLELVTPSENFHILPIIDAIYKRLNPDSKGRQKTDFKNSEILDREKNIRKFLSLLKGKSDLGIAAIANTFNVLFQLAGARSNEQFFISKGISTYFNTKDIIKNENGNISNIDYSQIFDEDGVLKSEFFSEFINAFVDVAKDDYVFAANVVTELSPLAFYMKFAGMSSKTILNFINQPAIRFFTKRMMVYQNKFAKVAGLSESARRKALSDTLRELGYYNKNGRVDSLSIKEYVNKRKAELGMGALDEYFTADNLEKGLRPDEENIASFSDKKKLLQIAMLGEMENLKLQSNSMTEAQRALNFDTNPYKSSFDIFTRNKVYTDAKNGKSVLSSNTLENIKKNSIISHLDMGRDMAQLLSDIFPIRNGIAFNEFLSNVAFSLKENIDIKTVSSQDDMLRFARTAKNDYMTYILQNFIDKSSEGKQFFQSTFETNKSFNEYMAELVETPKLSNMLQVIKTLPYYEQLCKEYPFIRNIVVEPGANNNKITTFTIVENSSNTVEKESVISQFDDLVNLEDPEFKIVRTFFRNLALYSTFQSGMNSSINSYTSLAPISIVNKLYGEAVKEYEKLTSEEQAKDRAGFYSMFVKNNPNFYGGKSQSQYTFEANNKGKWYANDVTLTFPKKAEPAPKKVIASPVGTKATVVIKDGTGATKEAARRREGVYVMRPNAGDNIPNVNENYNFGNPWSHAGYQGTIKTDTIDEATDNYEKWLKGEAFQEVEPERRKWILDNINAGRLDGKTLLYFKSGYRSHADVLADFINNRVKETKVVPVSSEYTNYHGGAKKYDTYWEEEGKLFGVTKHTVYTTNSYDALDKTTKDKLETKYNAARTWLGRNAIAENTYSGKLVRRDMMQAAKADAIFAVSEIVAPGTKGRKGYENKTNHPIIEGGTGYAAASGILLGKPVYVFNQDSNYGYDTGWYKWDSSANNFVKTETPVLTKNYAGIGSSTNETEIGRQAIKDVYEKTFKKAQVFKEVSDINSKINEWIEKEIPWTVETSAEKLAEMYNKEKLSGETIEEFLNRLSCLGKLI